jgi:hypothetical protein
MAFLMKYAIVPRYLTAPSRRRSGQPLDPGVRFVVAHDTGNPGSRAAANVAYYESTHDQASVSSHLFVDDRDILECIPALTGEPAEKAWHVLYGLPHDDRLYGHDANDAALGVEYCYGGGIDADAAYRRYVWVIAYACHRFGLDPGRDVVGHFFLDPERRTDPVTGLAHSRRSYEQLLRDIVLEHEECTQEPPPPPPPIPPRGRVRTRVRLNVRAAPHLRADIRRVLAVGTFFVYEGVETGEAVNGNRTWLRDAHGDYVWSGGVVWSGEAVEAPVPPAPPPPA